MAIRTVGVNKQYSTITLAINAASSGDEIWVYPGVYKETITPGNKNLIFRSVVRHAAIIDGELSRRCIYVTVSAALTYFVMDGFWIYRGKNTLGAGALFNAANDYIWISNCIFSDCTATTGNGGAINIYDSQSTGCPKYRIVNCLFYGNIATIGAAIYHEPYNASVSYLDCCIIGCTFSKNQAISRGGAITFYKGASPYIRNCIFWGNTAVYGYNFRISDASIDKPDVDYCIFQGGTEVSSVSVGSGSWSGYGANNSIADPLFTDSTNNIFTLQEGSPARNIGTRYDIVYPDEIATAWRDMLGRWRVNKDVGAYVYPQKQRLNCIRANAFRNNLDTTSTYTAKPIGYVAGTDLYKHNWYLGETISNCDATTGWTGTSLFIDEIAPKEGTGALVDSAVADANTIYDTVYTASLDLSKRHHIGLWGYLGNYTIANLSQCRILVTDTSGNIAYWDFVPTTYFIRYDFCLQRPNGFLSGTSINYANTASITWRVKTTSAGAIGKIIDWLTMNPLATDNVTIYDDGTAINTNLYTLSPSGKIYLKYTPGSGSNMTATYTVYPSQSEITGAHGWDIENERELCETTDMADNGYRAYMDESGIEQWFGGVNLYDDGDAYLTAGNEYNWRFYLDTNLSPICYFEGKGKVGRVTESARVDSALIRGYSIKGTNKLWFENG